MAPFLRQSLSSHLIGGFALLGLGGSLFTRLENILGKIITDAVVRGGDADKWVLRTSSHE